MNPLVPLSGLLVDTNLLVLFVVGRVNPVRVRLFKRTQSYAEDDFRLLERLLGAQTKLVGLPHVCAELNTLVDLAGYEGLRARQVLGDLVALLSELPMPSSRAVEQPEYSRLGLTDAAIMASARDSAVTILSDDFALCDALGRAGLPVLNFTHLRAESGLL